MKVLLQRVSEASVTVASETVGEIGSGLLIFLGVEKGDDKAAAEKLVERCLNYRIFEDEVGKMNASLQDSQGEVLVVSQFTLAADTRKGRRPSFSPAADPELGCELYLHFIKCLRSRGVEAQTGQFGADMKVRLCNDGPATFLLET